MNLQRNITYECLLSQCFIKLNAVSNDIFKKKCWRNNALLKKDTKKRLLETNHCQIQGCKNFLQVRIVYHMFIKHSFEGRNIMHLKFCVAIILFKTFLEIYISV